MNKLYPDISTGIFTKRYRVMESLGFYRHFFGRFVIRSMSKCQEEIFALYSAVIGWVVFPQSHVCQHFQEL